MGEMDGKGHSQSGPRPPLVLLDAWQAQDTSETEAPRYLYHQNADRRAKHCRFL